MRRVVVALAAALLAAGGASAHDLVGAKRAEHYLLQAGKWQAIAASALPAGERAEALYRIGVMLDEIRELLNRDLAAHGHVRGLMSSHLVDELQRRGLPLAWSEKRRRFSANTRYFEQALGLAPAGPRAADAGLRLLRGRFHDGFDADPLAADEGWPQLAELVALATDLARREFQGETREEVDFMVAVLHARAALHAPDAAMRHRHGTLAREAIARFGARHSDSLRSAMMPVLREALGSD